MNKKLVFVSIIIIAIVLAGYFLTQRQTSPSAKVIRVGSFSRAVDYAPYLVARSKGWFEEVAERYNSTLEYTEFQSLPPINESFAADRLDVNFSAEAPAIVGRAAGIDIRIRGAGVSLIQEILVPQNSTVKIVKDLRGKKIAVAAGSSSHYGVVKILEQNGLAISDVQILDMSPPDAKAAFESGQVDAWAVWPPFVEQEEIAGKGRVLSGGDVFIQSIVVVREKFAKENLQFTKELLGVIKRAQDWIIENEQEAQSIVAQELNLPLAVIERAWPRHNFRPPLGEKEIADMQAKAEFLYELKLIKNKLNVAQELVEL